MGASRRRTPQWVETSRPCAWQAHWLELRLKELAAQRQRLQQQLATATAAAAAPSAAAEQQQQPGQADQQQANQAQVQPEQQEQQRHEQQGQQEPLQSSCRGPGAQASQSCRARSEGSRSMEEKFGASARASYFYRQRLAAGAAGGAAEGGACSQVEAAENGHPASGPALATGAAVPQAHVCGGAGTAEVQGQGQEAGASGGTTAIAVVPAGAACGMGAAAPADAAAGSGACSTAAALLPLAPAPTDARQVPALLHAACDLVSQRLLELRTRLTEAFPGLDRGPGLLPYGMAAAGAAGRSGPGRPSQLGGGAAGGARRVSSGRLPPAGGSGGYCDAGGKRKRSEADAFDGLTSPLLRSGNLERAPVSGELRVWAVFRMWCLVNPSPTCYFSAWAGCASLSCIVRHWSSHQHCITHASS